MLSVGVIPWTKEISYCKALVSLWNNHVKECPPSIDRQRLVTQDIPTKLIYLAKRTNSADYGSRARCIDKDVSEEDLNAYLVK